MVIDDYLNYLHESKWKRLLASGKLKKDDLRRIQKARLPKSKKKWIAGVEKGSDAKIKKAGVRSSGKYGDMNPHGKMGDKRMKNPMHSRATDTTVYSPKGLPKKKKSLGAIVKRHEADEAQLIQKAKKRSGGKIFDVKQTATVKGSHMSDEVLRRERELARTHSALYGKKAIKKLTKTRDKADDIYKNLKSKKQIKKYDKKEIKKHQKYLERLKMIRNQRKKQATLKKKRGTP